MLSFLGRALLALAFLTSAHQIARPEKAGDAVVRNVTMASQIAPFALLAGAFVLDASSLDLVARFGGDGLPLFYRISAVWGGRSGPLLLWAAILAVVTWFMAREGGPAALEVRIMHGWVLALLVLSWLLEPFAAATGGQGELHPLLQTDLMVIHPPVVFSYYALCLATASVALAGVLRRDSADAIHAAQLHWARAGFVLGSIGIGLGGLWAYTVLDWGGYWAWDPVETGSLLPWLALLLIVHVRAKPDSSSAVSASPAIGLLAGALAFHATLVTRANGVWASVHAFVADGEGTLADDPYLRVLDIAEVTPVGIEVTSYLIAIIVLGYYAYAHLRRQQWLALAATGRTSMLEAKPTLAAGLVLAYIAVGFWIGSSAVFALGLALILLVVHGDSENPPLHWIALGVLLMLYSAWFWLADITQAVTGMVPFLAPWLLSPEDENEMVAVLLPLEDASARTRVARTVPWYGGAAFLLLTWLLLTVEIDGSSLEAHELYGAPLIGLLAIALTLYAWGHSIDAASANALVAAALFASIALAYMSDRFPLPGDPHLIITSGITRGAVGLFLLTWLVFALPPTLQQARRTASKVVPKLREGGVRVRSNAARARLLGSHLAHLGILLLLIGHVLTTTLVDRSDPSHLVTLERDQPVEHDGYELVFVDTELISADDEAYDFGVGDGFVGVIVEVRRDGELIDTLRPGMLRFNSPSGAINSRSEVDRMTRLTGDTIVILDIFQSNDLLSSMIMGGTDDVETVRVTVHSLRGSHLVWAGWVLVMLGGALALASSDRVSQEAE